VSERVQMSNHTATKAEVAKTLATPQVNGKSDHSGKAKMSYAEQKARSPLKAIRQHCRDCMGGQVVEVRECPIPKCPLYPFRFGHRIKKGKAI